MISFVVGRGMGHQGRCISIAQRLLGKRRRVIVFGFKETHSYLKKNLRSCKWIVPYESKGHRSSTWLRRYGRLLGESQVVVHDWRPEIIEYKKKRIISPTATLASMYHSDFFPSSRDTLEMSRFKEHIVHIASQTDVFFHMNVLPPERQPKLECLYFPLPLITRPVKNKPKQIKAQLGLAKNEPFILVQMGSGLGQNRYKYIDEWYQAINRLVLDYRIVVAGLLQDESYRFQRKIIKIPTVANGKNLINAAELVITKPGMGILTDCISLRKPLLMTPADNPEREQKLSMLKKILGSDLAILPNTQSLEGKIKEALAASREFERHFSQIPTNGADIAANLLRKMEMLKKKDVLASYADLLKLTPYGSYLR